MEEIDINVEQPKKNKNSLSYDMGKSSIGMLAGLFATVLAERGFEAFVAARRSRKTTET